MRTSCPFQCLMLPTMPTSGRSGDRPNSRSHLSRITPNAYFFGIERVRYRDKLQSADASFGEILPYGIRDADDCLEAAPESERALEVMRVDSAFVRHAGDARHARRDHPHVIPGDRVIEVNQVDSLAAHHARQGPRFEREPLQKIAGLGSDASDRCWQDNGGPRRDHAGLDASRMEIRDDGVVGAKDDQWPVPAAVQPAHEIEEAEE